MNSVIVRALVEAGRQAQIIDPVAGARLLERLSGVPGDDLRQALNACDAVSADLRHRLGRLLAPTGKQVGGWSLHARLPAVTGQSWLATNEQGELASVRILSGRDLGDDLTEVAVVRRRFQREADACRRLDHPNLVRVLDGGSTAEGDAWFVLEYVDGGNLAMALRLAGGHFDEATTVALGVQIASALAELARLGLVHRGVSPTSIQISANGVAKLGEYGLLRPGEGVVTLVQPRSVVNTIAPGLANAANAANADAGAWAAPELFSGGFVTPAVDVYALGCLMFACLTGQPPFTGTSLEVMRAHAIAPPPDLQRLVPRVTNTTAAAIASAMVKDPAQRPSIEALRSTLQTARDQVRSSSSSGSNRLIPVTSQGGTPRPGSTTTRSRRSMAMSGSMDDLPLGDLLQTIQRVKSEGILHLTHNERVFKIAFRQGSPVGFLPADQRDIDELSERLADDSSDLAGRLRAVTGLSSEQFLDALTHDPELSRDLPPEVVRRTLEEMLFDQLCRRCAGSDEQFEFVALSAEDLATSKVFAQGLQVHVPHLLMEAVRQADETMRLTRRLPPPWEIPLVAATDRAALLGEYRHYPERTLLERLDGACALAALPERAMVSPYAALHFCAELQERGLLQRLPVAACQATAQVVAQRSPMLGERFAQAALSQHWDDPISAGLIARAVAESGEITSITLASAVTRVGNVAGDPASALATPWLALLEREDGAGTAVHLYSGPELVMGKLARLPVHVTLRKYPEQQFLAESNQISRSHCSIAWNSQGTGWVVTDFGSGNGTTLDRVRLPPQERIPLPSGRTVPMDVAGVVRFQLCPVASFRPELPSLPPGMDPVPVTCPAALVVTREGNRPELAIALVRGRITLGGRGADIALPGVQPGPQTVCCCVAGSWWWCLAAGEEPWRPVIAGEPLLVGPLALTATVGDHRFFH